MKQEIMMNIQSAVNVQDIDEDVEALEVRGPMIEIKGHSGASSLDINKQIEVDTNKTR